MSRFFFIVILIVVFRQAPVAQNYIPYYNVVNEADFAISKGNYKVAMRHFERAFEIEKPQARDAYLLAYCLSELDKICFVKE